METISLEREKKIIKDKIRHDYSKEMLAKQMKIIESNPNLNEMEKIMLMGNIDSTFLTDVEKLKENLKEIENKMKMSKKTRGGQTKKQNMKIRKTSKHRKQ